MEEEKSTRDRGCGTTSDIDVLDVLYTVYTIYLNIIALRDSESSARVGLGSPHLRLDPWSPLEVPWRKLNSTLLARCWPSGPLQGLFFCAVLAAGSMAPGM